MQINPASGDILGANQSTKQTQELRLTNTQHGIVSN